MHKLLALLACLATPAPAWAASDLLNGPLPQIPNGYVVGSWYMPQGYYATAAGTAPGSGSIRCVPGYVTRTVTISNIGARVTTLFNTGNFQLAIYPASTTASQPTGTPLLTTASMSTSATGAISVAASVQLQGNTLYWFCANHDNATSALTSVASNVGVPALAGSSTLTVAIALAGAAFPGLSTPVAFNTWGDLTSATWVTVATATVPIIGFQIASVP